MSRFKFRAFTETLTQNKWVYFSIGEELDLVIDTSSIGQWTGFTDSKGIDVYEGDIIKAGGNSKPFAIEWGVINCSCCNSVIGWDDLASEYSNYEVIGNIYEHPELLEATQ